MAEASATLSVEVDYESLRTSMMTVRGLMFEVNSVRNLIGDTQRMAQDPSLSNAFWMGMQVQMTAQRIKQIPENLQYMTGGFTSLIGALGPYAIPAAILGGAAITLGALITHKIDEDKALATWEKRMADVAKAQGLTP